MSLVKIKEVSENGDEEIEEDPSKVVGCCDRHVLINSKISINNGDNINYVNFRDLDMVFEVQKLHTILREKDCHITTIERENLFLKEQVRSLNILLDQLSTSIKNSAMRNDIRIKVENASSLTFKKWYRRPKVMLTGSAILALITIYLRYKFRN